MHSTVVKTPRQLYVDLIKRSVAGILDEDPPDVVLPMPGFVDRRPQGYNRLWRERGRDIPSRALTMIGLRRLENIQACAEKVLADAIPGDFLEAGVWRGGATLLMRAILAAHGVYDRRVWLADSFAGLPSAQPERHPGEAIFAAEGGALAVDEATVRGHFQRYGLLDEQVCFLPGWFADTLAGAPIQQLALLRVDADLYSSVTEVFHALYPKVAPGGFVLVDDYFELEATRRAVDDYRDALGIALPVLPVDGNAGYWRLPR